MNFYTIPPPMEVLAFTKLLEKNVLAGGGAAANPLGGKMEIARLCPKMDIVAVVSSSSVGGDSLRNEVSLFRAVSWQRVWTWSASSSSRKKKDRILDVSWRPDGKVLAVHMAAHFVLLDVESGRELFLSDLTVAEGGGSNSAIQSLNPWLEVDRISVDWNVEEDFINLPNLSNLPSSKQSGGKFLIKSKDPFAMQSLKNFHDRANVLIKLDCWRHIHLVVFGVFQLDPITVPLQSEESKVLNVCLTPDLSRLSVLTSDSHLVVYDTKALRNSMAQLADVSKRWSMVNQLFFYLKQTLESVLKEMGEWQRHRRSFQDIVAKYFDLPSDDVSVQSLFLELLFTGNVPLEIETLLVKEMGTRKLMRLSETSESIIYNVKTLIQFYLIPCLQRLILKFEDLLVFNSEKLTLTLNLSFVLSDDTIMECLECAKRLYLLSENVLTELSLAETGSKEFFNWLSSCKTSMLLMHMCIKFLQLVAEIMDGGDPDTGANSFSEKELKPFDYEGVFKFLESGYLLGNDPLSFYYSSDESDINAKSVLSELQRTWEKLTSKPADHLGKVIKLTERISLLPEETGDQNAKIQIYPLDEGLVTVYRDFNADGNVIITCGESSGSSIETANLLFAFDGSVMKVSHIECIGYLEFIIFLSNDNDDNDDCVCTRYSVPKENLFTVDGVKSVFSEIFNPQRIIDLEVEAMPVRRINSRIHSLSVSFERKLLAIVHKDRKHLSIYDYANDEEEED